MPDWLSYILELLKEINQNYGILVAIFSAGVGWSIQISLYKRRVTFDLLLKLEENLYHMEARSVFKEISEGIGFVEFTKLVASKEPEIRSKQDKVDVYLNFLELISEFIFKKQIDFSIFYSQWGERFVIDIRAAAPYVAYSRETERRPKIWIWTERLYRRFRRRQAFDHACALPARSLRRIFGSRAKAS